jgi:1-aminocyclopropane-1-carboxylate deaminase
MDILQFEKQFLRLPSAIDEIHDELFDQKGIRVFVKRDDLIHPIISGNKWRKLREYIQIAQFNEHKHLISFGGAYSNHLYALAFAAKELGFAATGIIRGDELTSRSNLYLSQMEAWGMDLQFVSRSSYQKKEIPQEINTSNAIIIAEGGYGKMAIKGIFNIALEISGQNFEHIICPIGTGTTYLGLCESLEKAAIHGILTLNNFQEIESNAVELGIPTQQIYDAYIFGKYARQPEELVNFCQLFEQKHQIKIEPIYTGKMFYGLYDLIQKDKFKPGSNILALHTGGIKS